MNLTRVVKKRLSVEKTKKERLNSIADRNTRNGDEQANDNDAGDRMLRLKWRCTTIDENTFAGRTLYTENTWRWASGSAMEA